MKNKRDLTEAQNNAVLEIEFALIRAIINLDREKLWELIKDAYEKGDG